MGMSAGGGGPSRAPMSEINVTPLVDVMLVLLIIFMVTAPLLTAGVEVKPTSFSWVRFEYRHDFSTQPTGFLGRRGQATRRDQGTLALALGLGF